MEPNIGPSFLGEELPVTASINQSINTATTWSRIISIVSFVLLALILIGSIVGGSVLATVFTNEMPEGTAGIMEAALIFAVIIVCAIAGVLLFFLWRFSTRTRKGLQTKNQFLFNQGLAALKIYFIIYGALALLGLFFTALSLFTLM